MNYCDVDETPTPEAGSVAQRCRQQRSAFSLNGKNDIAAELR